MDPAACARVADGRRRRRRDGAGGEGLAAATPKYAEAVDRESAREKLAAKLEAGAAKARPSRSSQEQATTPTDKLRKEGDRRHVAQPPARRRAKEKSVVEEVLTSTTARQLGRTAVREIFRGLFKTGRR